MRICYVVLSVFFLCFSCAIATKNTDDSFFITPVNAFQKFISSIDGDRCSMYPSCSSYAKAALETEKFPVGYFMVCDRLLRCGRSETKIKRATLINGRFLFIDTLEENLISNYKDEKF